MKTRKLYRSRRNKVVAGVAAGIGEYLSVDPVIFRILFIFLTFAGGSGAVLYLILMIVMPIEPLLYDPSGNGKFQNAETESQEAAGNYAEQTVSENEVTTDERVDNKQSNGKLVGLAFGIILIVFGLYVLSAKILNIDWMKFVFPIIIVVSGVVILISSLNSKNNSNHA